MFGLSVEIDLVGNSRIFLGLRVIIIDCRMIFELV